jgi:hypothetical protein
MPCCRGPEVTAARSDRRHGNSRASQTYSDAINPEPLCDAKVAGVLNRRCRDLIEPLCLSEAL